jgi:hypothetical protein
MGSCTLFAGDKCYQRHEFHALQTPCPPLLARVRALSAFSLTTSLNFSYTVMLCHTSLHPSQVKSRISAISAGYTCHYLHAKSTTCPSTILPFNLTISLTIPLLLLHFSSFPADDSNEGTMDIRPKIKMSPPVTGHPDMHSRQMESFDHLIGTYG